MGRLSESEAYVQGLFSDRYGLALRKIPETNTPTADFEVLDGGTPAFVAEVKSFTEHDIPTFGIDDHIPDLVPGSLRNDNAVARVGNAIHEAATQLAQYGCAKVLVLVNFEMRMDVHDLFAAFNGWLPYVDAKGRRSFDSSAQRVAEGRIKESKFIVDLYVWIERRKAKVSFKPTNEIGHDLKRRFFGDTQTGERLQ